MLRVFFRTIALFLLVCTRSFAGANERPNIVWLSCEDISSHLGCYGDPNATTPHLDAFAEQGVRYTRAFTVHGVCAPCRTGIITGMYPMGIGANHMRSKATLPEHIKCFPEYLKQAGYYCTNNSKTDYNFKWEESEVWDESSKKAHWKNRTNADQPFFAVFNMTMTHESKIWPEGWKKIVKDLPQEQLHDPSKIKVPKLYPDTPAVRAAHARLLDIITVMDLKVGEYLQELEDAGLAESTIVIYWSDHGNGFPRAKRWIYDSGTLVPMIARVPEKYRTDDQAHPGSVSDQLINLIDLGPTVLNLAGIDVPDHMFGRPFLGENLPAARQYIHAARDRIDERFDLVRSVRSNRFRYVRNLNSWRPALQYISYAERSVVRKEMRRLKADGTLHPESAQFLNDTRPTEELYDLESDPWELNNVVDNPKFVKDLARLQQECDRWQLDVRDAHLIPESILDTEERQHGSRWGILNSDPKGGERTESLLTLAKMARQPTPADLQALLKASLSSDAALRWWALTGLANLADKSNATQAAVTKLASDKSEAVQIAAAKCQHMLGQTDVAVASLSKFLHSDNDFLCHAALIELDDIGKDASPAAADVRLLTAKKGYIGNVAQHIMSTLAP